MIRFHLSAIFRFLTIVCLVTIVTGAFSAAMAQRTAPGGSDRGGRGGGGGGIGNAGRLILQFAPAIINNLDDDDDDDRERARPRRTKPRARQRDEEPKKQRRRDTGIIRTAIPPLPIIPPERFPPSPAPSDTPPTPLRRANAVQELPAFKPGEVVVLVDGAPADAIAAGIAQTLNLNLQESLNLTTFAPSQLYLFSIPDARTVEAVVTAVVNVPGVGYAGPNRYYRLQGDARSAGLNLQYALPKMRVPAAREVVSGRGMTVAIIDSGVDTGHPSLKDANLTLIDMVKYGVDGPDKHGTAIAGIIAANGDMVGIAPGANILAIRAFASESLGEAPVTTVTTLLQSVDEGFRRGARIFNMSFAGERDELLIRAIDKNYAQGAIFVAAVGNEGPNAPPAYPAAYEKVIAITATDETDAIYDRANRGGYVVAAAPGVDILVPVTGQGFDYLSGTSFAAAHVTGVIALLMERNPGLTAETLRTALTQAAHDLGPVGQDTDFGAGLTDAYAALMLVSK